MAPRREDLIRDVRNTAIRTVFLGLSLGYVVFYAIYPTASFPASDTASFGYALLLLASTAVLAGLATERLAFVVIQALVSVFVGGGVATAILMSPALANVILVSAADVPFYMVHYGFPFLLIGFLTSIVFGLVGLGLREYFLLRYRYNLPPSWAANRK